MHAPHERAHCSHAPRERDTLLSPAPRPPLCARYVRCAAGKVTLELAADIKMGLMGMSPLNRWVLYSTVKPLFDVGSWDKLVECLRKVVPMS